MNDFDSQEPTWHTAFAKLLFPYHFRESQEEVLTQLDNELSSKITSCKIIEVVS